MTCVEAVKKLGVKYHLRSLEGCKFHPESEGLWGLDRGSGFAALLVYSAKP